MITLLADSPLPTDLGTFHLFVFENAATTSQEIALTYGPFREHSPVLVRLHSACITSEIFGANNCECREQLDEAKRRMVAHGSGIILYLAQEGRGHGLAAKVKTLNQVVQGMDPQAAFADIGLPTDARDYAVAVEILKALGVTGPVELLTNNPGKVKALQDAGIAIARQTDLYIEPKNPAVRHALEAKRDKEGHLLPSAMDIRTSPRC